MNFNRKENNTNKTRAKKIESIIFFVSYKLNTTLAPLYSTLIFNSLKPLLHPLKYKGTYCC